ncbi:hypothetical protein HQN60_06535 [Deefgea piscis]|uniref:Uncharacterized protein n=1 Tax=Deefgea piscis TaxID=2739061 RepID=A0A6M8SMF5_9NEIS|nr:hypothetical protein [Deefgea piscis]QKJ66382.1 hypothetical protein HQN60_06535 [Deefgea piscis]
MLTPNINTDIPAYGVDDLTEQSWQWLHAVGQLAAQELAAMPKGTLALLEAQDRVYWVALIHDEYYLATATIFDGEINIEHGALLRDLYGFSIEELNFMREGLTDWLTAQTTLKIAEPRQLQRWSELPVHSVSDDFHS